MDHEVVEIGGLVVPLSPTPFGPIVALGKGGDDIDLLRWVVNAALEGELPGLAESVERGETRSDGTATARPVANDDDVAEARAAWRERTGHDLGDDAYAVGVQWRGRSFILPRAVLAGLVRRLEALRTATPKPPPPWLFAMLAPSADPHPSEELLLRSLETRAAEVDAWLQSRREHQGDPQVAVKRRMLLAELEAYGILTGPMGHHRERWLVQWQLPTLLGYQRAAIAIGEYWSSGPRRLRIGPPPNVGSVVGASVSVDYFRTPSEAPPSWDPNDWLAFCERALLDAPSTDGYDGELFIHTGETRCAVHFRRDDGQHPAVVRAIAR